MTNCSEGEDGKVKGSIFWFSVPATLPDEGQEEKYGTPKKNSDAESIQKGTIQKNIDKLETMNTKNNHKMVSEAALKEMENPGVKVSLSKSDPKHLKSSIVATTPNSFVVETTRVEDEAAVNAASKRKLLLLMFFMRGRVAMQRIQRKGQEGEKSSLSLLMIQGPYEKL